MLRSARKPSSSFLARPLAVCYNSPMEKVYRTVSVEEAERLDIEDQRHALPEERLDTLQVLRELYYELKNEDRKGLQRVYRIVEQK